MKAKDARLYARGKISIFGNYRLKLISKLDSLTLQLIPSVTHIGVTTFPAKILLGIFPFESEKLSENSRMSVRLHFTGDDNLLECVIPRNDNYKFYHDYKAG